MVTIKSYSDLYQSKKLAEILPLESADMYLWSSGKRYYIEAMDDGDFNEEEGHVRAWSLAALLDVIKEQGLVDLRFLQSTYDNRGNQLTNVWWCTFENLGTVSLDLYADNPVDTCVAMIKKLHELNLL